MSADPSSWYIPGEENEPVGPFSTEQIIESWQAGRLGADTLIWREGMTQWQPLAQVEPFASVLQSGRAFSQSPTTAAGYGMLPGRRQASHHRTSLRPRGPGARILAASIGGGVALFVLGVAALAIVPRKSGSDPIDVAPPRGRTFSDATVLAGARKEIESRLLRCGDSWYGFGYGGPAMTITPGERARQRPDALIEMKGFSVVRVRSEAISPANRENGIQWHGTIFCQCEVFRTVVVREEGGTIKLAGQWGPWQDGTGDPCPPLKKRRGGPPLFALGSPFATADSLALTIARNQWRWCVTDAEKPSFDCASLQDHGKSPSPISKRGPRDRLRKTTDSL